MPTVYVTQIPVRKDKETNSLVPAVNIVTAKEYGELITLMPSRVSYANVPDMLDQIAEKLDDYNDDNGDVLLPLGDPAITAMAVGFLAVAKGKFSVLKWDRNVGRYFKTTINFK